MDNNSLECDQLTKRPTDNSPEWSSDSKKVAFLSRRTFKEDEVGTEIWILNIEKMYEPRLLVKLDKPISNIRWSGKILWIDLSKGKSKIWEYLKEMSLDYIDGRGFAVRILWDYLKQGTDPLSPANILIFAVGPLTGLSFPSSGKIVVAAKSSLTGGYGDGNVGTRASVQLRRASYDVIVVEGKADKPTYILVEDICY